MSRSTGSWPPGATGSWSTARAIPRAHWPLVLWMCAPRRGLLFHMAQSMTLFGYFPSYYWSRYMMAHYPPEITAWIVSKVGLTPDLKILRGEELAALVPSCSSEGEESQSQPESPRLPALVYGSRGAGHSRPLPPPDASRETDGNDPPPRGRRPKRAHRGC